MPSPSPRPSSDRPPSDLPDTPIALVELGPSAGLNLHADQYAVSWDRGRGGAPGAIVACPAQVAWRSGDPPEVDAALAPIVARIGLYSHPIDVRTDHYDVAWLEACLWPENSSGSSASARWT